MGYHRHAHGPLSNPGDTLFGDIPLIAAPVLDHLIHRALVRASQTDRPLSLNFQLALFNDVKRHPVLKGMQLLESAGMSEPLPEGCKPLDVAAKVLGRVWLSHSQESGQVQWLRLSAVSGEHVSCHGVELPEGELPVDPQGVTRVAMAWHIYPLRISELSQALALAGLPLR